MAVAGVVIIAFGFFIVRQINVNHRVMFPLKGTFFQNPNCVALTEIFCFFLFLAGSLMLDFLPLLIRVVLCVVLVFFWLMDFLRRGEPYIARKIIRIYKASKLKSPTANEQEALKDTAAIYLKSIGADDGSINSVISSLDRTRDDDFAKLTKISSEEKECFELRVLIGMLLNYHHMFSLHSSPFDSEHMRRDKNIEIACIREGVWISR